MMKSQSSQTTRHKVSQIDVMATKVLWNTGLPWLYEKDTV